MKIPMFFFFLKITNMTPSRYGEKDTAEKLLASSLHWPSQKKLWVYIWAIKHSTACHLTVQPTETLSSFILIMLRQLNVVEEHTHAETHSKVTKKPWNRQCLIQYEQRGISIKMLSCINMRDNMRKSSWTGVCVSLCVCLCECVCIMCLCLRTCLAWQNYFLLRVCKEWAQ